MPRSQSHPPRIKSSAIVETSNEEEATQIDDNIYEEYVEMFAWTYLMTVDTALEEFEKRKRKMEEHDV